MKKLKNIKTDDYQTEILNEFSIRTKFSFFPIILVNDEFVWTGVWFKNVIIKEQKYKVRYTDLNEWNYTLYWKPWMEEWAFIQIIK